MRVMVRALARLRRRGLALAACLLVGAFAVGPAFAQVSLGFYAHGSSAPNDKRMHLPHAVIRLYGVIPDTRATLDEHYEFQPALPPVSLLPVNTPGTLVTNPGPPNSNEYFEIPLSDETYAKIANLIAYWRSPKGSTYNLYKRNCVDFVAAVAEAVGLDVPPNFRTKPAKFMEDLTRRNAATLARAPGVTRAGVTGGLSSAGRATTVATAGGAR